MVVDGVVVFGADRDTAPADRTEHAVDSTDTDERFAVPEVAVFADYASNGIGCCQVKDFVPQKDACPGAVLQAHLDLLTIFWKVTSDFRRRNIQVASYLSTVRSKCPGFAVRENR